MLIHSESEVNSTYSESMICPLDIGLFHTVQRRGKKEVKAQLFFPLNTPHIHSATPCFGPREVNLAFLVKIIDDVDDYGLLWA